MDPKTLRFVVLLLCIRPTTSDWRTDSLGPGPGLMAQAFEEMGKHPNEILKIFSMAARTREQKDSIMRVRPLGPARATGDEQRPDTGLTCVGCQIAFLLIPFIVQNIGLNLDQLGGPVTMLCETVFGFINSDNPLVGVQLCSGLVKAYAPHVQIIAQNVRMNAQDSCFMTHFCFNNVVSLDIPGLISGLLSQRSVQFKDELAPKPFLSMANVEFKEEPVQKRRRRQAGVLKVVQFTDIHVDFKYKMGTYTDCGLPLCCHELPSNWPNGKGSAGPYGDFRCNVPPRTSRLFFAKLANINPDIVLQTGDSPSNIVWQETLEGQLNGTEWVAAQLKTFFPGAMGIYSTLGNHDTFPTNMYRSGHPHTEMVNQVFYESYKDLSKLTAEQEATIKYSGYHTVLIKPGLRLLSINSLFGEAMNWYNLLNRFEPQLEKMWEFMTTTLQNARANNEKVIITVHHPSGSLVEDFDDKLTDIINDFGDVIVLNVAGHRHTDSFRIFRNDAGGAFSVQFLSQSSNSYNHINPGARIYYLDATTYQLVDYDQYYLDVNKAGAQINKLYSAKEEYGLSNFSPQSMLDLAVRMKNDEALFKKYYDNRRTKSKQEGSCESENCINNNLCSLVTSTKRHRNSCVKFGFDKLDYYPRSVFSINTATKVSGMSYVYWLFLAVTTFAMYMRLC